MTSILTQAAFTTITTNAVDLANTLFDSLVAHPEVAEDAVRIAMAIAANPNAAHPRTITDLCTLLEQGPDVFSADTMRTIQEAKFLAEIAADFTVDA